MRNLFIILAKLAGLFQLYWAFVNFMQIGFALVVMLSESEPFGSPYAGIIGTVGYFCLSLFLSWVLLMRTEWLADKIKVTDETDVNLPDTGSLMRIGIKLIGLYVIVNAVPGVIREGVTLWNYVSGQGTLFFWTRFVPVLIQFGLGLLFVLRTEKVLTWVCPNMESDV